MKRGVKPAVLLATVGLLSTLTALAQTRVWVGGTDTDWTNSANWQNGTLPEAGDDVLIPDGTPHNAWIPAGTWPETGRYGDFTVAENATAVCLGNTNAINEASGGTEEDRHGIGVTIRCADAYIDGTLSADAQGFPVGNGPGYGAGGVNNRPASHGGRLHRRGDDGDVYGNAIAPTALGSGGDNSAGGGAIAIDATGLIRVDGTLSANSNGGIRGTGSGGSIYLQCDVFEGAATGRIRAEAGHGSADEQHGSAGGGGRVAIVYNTSSYAGRVSVRGGNTGTDGRAQPGTLWEPGRYAGATGSPEAPLDVLIQDGFQYLWPDAAVTNYWNLTVSNAWFEVHDGALAIGDFTLEDRAYFRSDDYVDQDFSYRGGYARTMDFLTVTGDMTVRGDSHLFLPAWTYDLKALTLEAGSTLYPVGDPTIVNAASGGSVENPHGAGPVIRADSAVVDGAINGIGLGYPAFEGPGTIRDSGNFSGSHGGQGTDAVFYGRMTHPTALGSGGGREDHHSGGSAVHLEVRGELTLNGDIDVTGIGLASGLQSGASGSIRLKAHTLTGGGSLLAGVPVTSTANPPGGGRIAMGVVDDSNWTGAASVQVKTDSNHSDGTIFFCRSVDLDGAIEANTTGGATITTTLDEDRQGARLDRNITEWRPSGTAQWTDTSTFAETGDPLPNLATYTMSGLTPHDSYSVFIDEVKRSDITGADGDGRIVIEDVVIDHSVTVRIQAPSGTLIRVR